MSDAYTCTLAANSRTEPQTEKVNTDGSKEITLPWCGDGHDPAVMYGRAFPAPTGRQGFETSDSEVKADRREAWEEHQKAHG